MRIVAIVQARLGSARLPLKSLLTLQDEPIIDWVAERLQTAKRLADIIFALPDTELDAILAARLKRKGFQVFSGSENDVLGRFCGAAAQADADLVARVCADNPFIWGKAVDDLIDFHLKSDADYSYNHIPLNNAWPDGLGAEIISRDLLEKISSLASAPAQREHCLNFIREHPDQFRIRTYDPAEEWLKRPDVKLDVDSPADYQRLASLDLSPAADAREIIAAWDRRAAIFAAGAG